MIQRRGKPSFSKDDEERLLAYMDVTRHLTINYGAAYGFHSPQYTLRTSLIGAIDKLAEQITGDPKFFWQMSHSIGGGPEGLSPRQERELRWQELRRKYQRCNLYSIISSQDYVSFLSFHSVTLASAWSSAFRRLPTGTDHFLCNSSSLSVSTGQALIPTLPAVGGSIEI
jgi:hypothetical protein